MKFIFTAEINSPVEKCFELFLNKDNLKEWQKELTSYELISGAPGSVGAVTRLNYKTVTIIETISLIDVPREMKGFYEHKHRHKPIMTHHTSYRFSQVSENRTLCELEMYDVQFLGFLPKLLSKLMAGMFKKYHQDEVNRFKEFVEKQS